MRKSFLSASAVLLLLPWSANALGIQVIVDGKAVVFSDVSQTAWFSGYVHDAAEAGIVSGYRDAAGNLTGKFKPANSVTMAEALKIAVEGAGYDKNKYSTVIESGVGSHWASPYVSVAVGEQFAVTINRLRLNQVATRAEVASIFASAFRVDMDTEFNAPFLDVQSGSPNASAIAALQRDGVVSGDTDANGNPTGTFRPYDSINRAETVKIVLLARKTYGEPGKGRVPPTDTAQQANVVTYTDAGFSPSVLHVKRGTAVQFVNQSSAPMWVASNPHPAHTDYPGFDALKAFGQGQTYIFTFTKIGSWGYHNHYHSSVMGTIIVEE